MWSITDGTNTWSVIDLHLVKTLDGLNNASVTLVDDIPLDTIVDIMFEDSIVLRGYVKSKTKTHDGEYKYEIVELAIELENQIVTDTDGSYTFIMQNATVNDVVDQILYTDDPKLRWTRGSSDTTSLGAVSFAYTRKLPALFKVLKELRGHKVWFDSTTKTVYFGDSRDDEGTLDYFTLSQETSTRNRNIDKVVVFSNDEEVYAEYGSGDKVAIYKYTSAKTEDECSLIAQRIYDELSQPYERIEVETKIDPNIDEGDLVTVDSDTYVVYRVEYNMFTMKVHLNENLRSVFDILGSKIIEMTGTMATGGRYVWVNYDGGWQNVDSSHSAKYELVIDNVDLVDQAVLTIKTDTYKYFLDTPYTEVDFATPPDNTVKVDTTKNVITIESAPKLIFDCGFNDHTTFVNFVVNGIAEITDPDYDEATLIFDFNSLDVYESDSSNIIYKLDPDQLLPFYEDRAARFLSIRHVGDYTFLLVPNDLDSSYMYLLRYNHKSGSTNVVKLSPNIQSYGSVHIDQDGYVYAVGGSDRVRILKSNSPYSTSFSEIISFGGCYLLGASILDDINNVLYAFYEPSGGGIELVKYDCSNGTYSTETIFTDTPDDGMSVALADDGSLHVFVPIDISTSSCILGYMRSTDGGNTWIDSNGNVYTIPMSINDLEQQTVSVNFGYLSNPIVYRDPDTGEYTCWIAGLLYDDNTNGVYTIDIPLLKIQNGVWIEYTDVYPIWGTLAYLVPPADDTSVTLICYSAIGSKDDPWPRTTELQKVYISEEGGSIGADAVTLEIVSVPETRYGGWYTYSPLVVDWIAQSSQVYCYYNNKTYETAYGWYYPNTIEFIGAAFNVPAIKVLVTGGIKNNINVSLNVPADLYGTHMRLTCYSVGGVPVKLDYYAHAIISTSHSHYNSTIVGVNTTSTYPSNISVIVNGNTVTTISGSSTESVEETVDITSYLQTGTNTIEITSDTQGSIFLSGKLKVLSFK